MSDDDKTFAEILEEYQDQEKMYNFEGNSGLEKLNKLCEAVGYRGHQFRFGSSLEEFLSDNPGACAALVDWLAENGTEDQKEELITNLKALEEPEDEPTDYLHLSLENCVVAGDHHKSCDNEGYCDACGQQ